MDEDVGKVGHSGEGFMLIFVATKFPEMLVAKVLFLYQVLLATEGYLIEYSIKGSLSER